MTKCFCFKFSLALSITGLVDTVVTARSDPSVVWGKYQELIRLRSTDAEENCQLLRARIEELRQSHRREIKNLTEEIEQAKKGQARSDSVAKSEANLDATSKTEIKKLRLQLAEAQKSSLALKLELNVAQKEQKQVAVTTKSDHKDTVKLHKAIKRKNEELDDISQQIQLIATERDELHSELLAMKATNKSLSAKLKKASGSQSQDLISALEKNADVMETLRNHEDLIQTYADLTGIAISQIPGSQRKLDCSLIQKDGQELAFTLTWSEDDSEIEYTPYDSNSYGANIQDYLQEIFVFKIEMLRKFFLTLSKCC
ncbi:hypothetical protein SARC_13122 [Sphaeroforma arctica JP610]|uniref:Spindle assembly checkpoint component MAD1 n=1 Tax=Sphaeroforma arctica JP610 TaxID=667725 RepID=A0A0L0FC27_9EUKA|nr:hypothetical protein SARC_13122 [Sphaeroforma arctica JP610]KNC74327.1 hypothetical protein SARC_13122 [Sphaeroforma arctica JP610]|eukprot:XP_014148229.1 hypothetical protein SARC_13122 [Sphaeroforma arctica JP610]